MADEETNQTVEEETLEESTEETSEDTTKQSSAEPEGTPKKKKEGFHKTRKGGIIISVIISILLFVFIFQYEGPATPIVFGFVPLRAIGLLSIVLSLLVTLSYKYLTDQVIMREHKKELKKLQKQMKAARGDTKKVSELSKKSMEVNMKYMRQMMKPMLITIVPFLLIFQYLRSAFDSTIILTLPFWPHTLGWIGTYIVLSMIFTTAFRKILDVV